MKIKTALPVIITSLFSTLSFAESTAMYDYSLTYWGKTFHLQSNERNERNNIIGVRYDYLELGTMINSFERRSWMLSYYKTWAWNDWIDYGFRLGGMTGYTMEENPYQALGITPLVAPLLDFHYRNVGVEVSLANRDVLVVQFNVKF